MTETETEKEPFMHRNAWIVFIVVAVIFVLFGIGDVIRGMDADPAIAESIAGETWENVQSTSPALADLVDLVVRSQGFTITILSILSIAITLYAFRPGERWGWYALWIWPVWNVAIFLTIFTADRHSDFSAPPPMLSAPVFFSITFLALVLSYRRFFRKA